MFRDRIIDALRDPLRPAVSVEFFPPKDAGTAETLLRTARALQPLGISQVRGEGGETVAAPAT